MKHNMYEFLLLYLLVKGNQAAKIYYKGIKNMTIRPYKTFQSSTVILKTK